MRDTRQITTSLGRERLGESRPLKTRGGARFGKRNKEYGIWNTEYGIWNMVGGMHMVERPQRLGDDLA